MAETVTEADKLHLVMVVADEVARKYGIADPCELWGEGWLGVKISEAKWDRGRPFLPFASQYIRGAICHFLRKKGIDTIFLAV